MLRSSVEPRPKQQQQHHQMMPDGFKDRTEEHGTDSQLLEVRGENSIVSDYFGAQYHLLMLVQSVIYQVQSPSSCCQASIKEPGTCA